MITSTTHPINNGSITVVEGSNVTLRCEVTGNGTLKYRWMRVSGLFPTNIKYNDKRQSLTILTIAVSDSGQYYCEVNSGGVRVSSMKLQVTVISEIMKHYS